MNDESDSSAFSAVRKVNVLLAPLLVELYGEVQPLPPVNCERTIQAYGIEVFGFHCRISSVLSTDAAVTLSVIVRVGRFYRGYRRALRWLANNRSRNTVSLSFVDHHAMDSELWVTCGRITTPQDVAGLREALADVNRELEVVDAGLRMWFPHVLRGHSLLIYEEAAESDESVRLLIESPEDFLKTEHEQSVDQWSTQFSHEVFEAFGWLERWDEQLRYVERFASELDDDKAQIPLWRARALLALRRWEELLATCRELEETASESDKPMILGVVAQALYEMGEYEEVLDVLRSATLDNTVRVWLYRSLAQAKLGNVEEAMTSYSEYERMIGRDIIASRMLAEVMPDTDEL